MTYAYAANWQDNTDMASLPTGRTDVWYDTATGTERWFTCASHVYSAVVSSN